MRYLVLFFLLISFRANAQFEAGRYQTIDTLYYLDDDGDENYFTITAGNTSTLWQIYPCSGVLQVDTNAYNTFARQKTYYLTIAATDARKKVAKRVYNITLKKSATGARLKPVIVQK